MRLCPLLDWRVMRSLPVLFVCAVSVSLLAQTTPQTAPQTEVGASDAGITFQSKVSLVQVPVVVRDKTGKPVDHLTKEDFQLFDKGKPQIISRFAIEKAPAAAVTAAPRKESSPDEKTGDASSPAVTLPGHFVAWFFDDVHIEFAELAFARQAAEKFFAEGLKESDRAAIFTTSGQTTVEFTDDLSSAEKRSDPSEPSPSRPSFGARVPRHQLLHG